MHSRVGMLSCLSSVALDAVWKGLWFSLHTVLWTGVINFVVKGNFRQWCRNPVYCWCWLVTGSSVWNFKACEYTSALIFKAFPACNFFISLFSFLLIYQGFSLGVSFAFWLAILMVFWVGSSVLRKWSFVIFLCLNRLSQEQYRTSRRNCSISCALSSAVIVTWQLKRCLSRQVISQSSQRR